MQKNYKQVLANMVGRGLVIDCAPVATHAKIEINAHFIMFNCKMFDKYLNHTKNYGQGKITSPYQNTVELLKIFLSHAENLKKGSNHKSIVFPHWDMWGKPWQCRATAHQKGEFKILTFKEER